MVAKLCDYAERRDLSILPGFFGLVSQQTSVGRPLFFSNNDVTFPVQTEEELNSLMKHAM